MTAHPEEARRHRVSAGGQTDLANIARLQVLGLAQELEVLRRPRGRQPGRLLCVTASLFKPETLAF